MAEQKKTASRRGRKPSTKSTQKKEESLLQEQPVSEKVEVVEQQPVVESVKEEPAPAPKKKASSQSKQKELSVGSLVKMPIGDKQGTVTKISEKGVVSVKVDLDSNKIYTFLSNELTLL